MVDFGGELGDRGYSAYTGDWALTEIPVPK
jgi:hypothetical protein